MSHHAPLHRPPSSAAPAGQVQVGAWHDLDDLARALDVLEQGAAGLVRYARAEVCDPSGFQPSEVCVLRPLVPVLHRVERAFADLGHVLGAEVQRLQAGVLTSAGELADADAAAARSAGVLAPEAA